MSRKSNDRPRKPNPRTDHRPLADRATVVHTAAGDHVEIAVARRGSVAAGAVILLDVDDWVRLQAWIEEAPGMRGLRIFDSTRTYRRRGRAYSPKLYGQLLDRSGGRLQALYLHRWLLNAVNAGKSFQVRHLNDDGLDNRRANLAVGSASENATDAMRNKLRRLGVTAELVEAEMQRGRTISETADRLAVDRAVVETVRRRARAEGRCFPHPFPGRPRKAAVNGAA